MTPHMGISIQVVSNGWIVRQQTYGPCDRVLAVFNKLEDLQAALPKLLAVEQKDTEGTEA